MLIPARPTDRHSLPGGAVGKSPSDGLVPAARGFDSPAPNSELHGAGESLFFAFEAGAFPPVLGPLL
jgi:hypothetical protein